MTDNKKLINSTEEIIRCLQKWQRTVDESLDPEMMTSMITKKHKNDTKSNNSSDERDSFALPRNEIENRTSQTAGTTAQQRGNSSIGNESTTGWGHANASIIKINLSNSISNININVNNINHVKDSIMDCISCDVSLNITNHTQQNTNSSLFDHELHSRIMINPRNLLTNSHSINTRLSFCDSLHELDKLVELNGMNELRQYVNQVIGGNNVLLRLGLSCNCKILN